MRTSAIPVVILVALCMASTNASLGRLRTHSTTNTVLSTTRDVSTDDDEKLPDSEPARQLALGADLTMVSSMSMSFSLSMMSADMYFNDGHSYDWAIESRYGDMKDEDTSSATVEVKVTSG